MALLISWFLIYIKYGHEPRFTGCDQAKKALPNLIIPDEPIKVPTSIFYDQYNKIRKLSDYLGHGLVLNFWATWCSPCVKEMPHLNRLHRILKPSNIDVLAVSEDRQGLKVVRQFYRINNLTNLEILIDPKGKLLRAAGGRGLPTTILIDQQGYEVGRLLGGADWDTPESINFLKRCLGS